MSEGEKRFIDVLKKQLIVGIMGYLLISVGSLVAFYFNTNSAIDAIKKEQTTQRTEQVLMKKEMARKASKDDLYHIETIIQADLTIIKEHLLNKN